jgi:hypothetical protein
VSPRFRYVKDAATFRLFLFFPPAGCSLNSGA